MQPHETRKIWSRNRSLSDLVALGLVAGCLVIRLTARINGGAYPRGLVGDQVLAPLHKLFPLGAAAIDGVTAAIDVLAHLILAFVDKRAHMFLALVDQCGDILRGLASACA